MKHIAILRSGGKVEITLPLHNPDPKSRFLPGEWRQDQHGVLINLAEVAAIVGVSDSAPNSRGVSE